ncbi:cyanophycinase [Oxalobacteraceae bacterium A2-2]
MQELQHDPAATLATASAEGHLLIIGGHEDREDDKEILARFVELSGGKSSRIVVITAASTVPDKVWDMYQRAFADLGVADCVHLEIASRADANAPASAGLLRGAGGIFMTGGDQKRLLANIGGTALDEEMHAAYRERGACVAGTSAGASAMSGHMLAAGQVGTQPEKGAVNMGAGLGLLHGVVVDQHFSERHRLPRLLTLVAQNPYLLGIGIDEDTALLVRRGVGIEVLGSGTVTVVDGRDMHSTMADTKLHDCPELIDVRLHLLPSGSRYCLAPQQRPGTGAPAGCEAPAPLLDFLRMVTGRKEHHSARLTVV